MIFAHTSDQLDLREGAREFLRGTCSVELLRELKEQSSPASPLNVGLWNQLTELGLTDFMLSEDLGGMGMDAIGFTLIAEEAGYVALPEPLLDVAGIVAPLLSKLDHKASTRVRSFHPLNPYINQLEADDSLIVFANDSIYLYGANQYQSELVESIDPLRRLSKIDLSNGNGELLAEGETAEQLASLALNHGALFTAAELLGLAAAMIDMATEYAKERQQFGKPIGSYQAVKHHLATALVKLEFARPVVYRASAELATGSLATDSLATDSSAAASRAISHAKVAAIDSAVNAAEAAIQVHGAMGYTFEVDLHLWMKRSWALAGQWGDRNFHMSSLESQIFDEAVNIGPSNTFV
jgi:alkylation response protein AidB-like acyl-CoA dehydrogenase